MRGMIFAVSPDGVIGQAGTIPWRHPGDMRRFKRVTMGTTVIMGRKTYESMGRALPGRRNIVVSSSPIDAPGIEHATSIAAALALSGSADVWFIGGARIYAEAMPYVEVIDVTYVPDVVDGPDVVRAPPIDEAAFAPGPLVPHEDEAGLTRREYRRR
jgi:dihydrofolate reductase